MASLHSNWDYYTEEYGGRLSPDEYRRWVPAAHAHIAFCTSGKSQCAPESMLDRLRRCECEMTDALQEFAQVPRGVVSVNNDGYAATFGSRFAGGNTESENLVLEKISRRYLAMPVNLLYRGVANAQPL